jgi:hypothetical protein
VYDRNDSAGIVFPETHTNGGVRKYNYDVVIGLVQWPQATWLTGSLENIRFLDGEEVWVGGENITMYRSTMPNIVPFRSGVEGRSSVPLVRAARPWRQ